MSKSDPQATMSGKKPSVPIRHLGDEHEREVTKSNSESLLREEEIKSKAAKPNKRADVQEPE